VEMATGVAPTDGIFISASGGNAFPLDSTKLLVVEGSPVTVVAAAAAVVVVGLLLLGLDAAATDAVVLLPSFVGN